jgi:glycosyltransferase involved in cell wall biosynthesis
MKVATIKHKKKTTVSVCIPTYNNADMISDAIASVLGQTFTNFELLVADNCSTDATQLIVRNFMSQDGRIRYVRHDENLGMANNFNFCIGTAQGDYVMVLGADDLLLPECLASLVTALANAPQAVFAACARTFVNERLEPLKVLRRVSRVMCIDGATLMRECVGFGNKIGEPSAVLFKRVLTSSRGFNPGFSQFLDLEMWLYLLKFGPAIFLPAAYSVIRQHAQQTTKANLVSGRLIEEKRKLFREVIVPANLRLRVIDKAMWDLRMVVSITRFRKTGGRIDASLIQEIFSRPWFLFLLRTSDVIQTCTRPFKASRVV